MNYLYFGRSCDLNIGNGKTVSAVRQVLKEHLTMEKQIFSNIKLMGVEYTELTPKNLYNALDTKDAIILFDELHAIIDLNHKITTTCKKHSVPGLCFEVSEFFRQVRKSRNTTVSTVQTFSDCVYRLKVVMQEMIICEKFHIENETFVKCNTDICPDTHGIHYIRQTNYRTGEIVYFDPEPFYGLYDSSEIVHGWNISG